MASPTQWTWIWTSSRILWWTAKPGALQSMGSQRVKHNWVTDLNLPWVDGTRCHDLSFFECWVLSQLFHTPLTFIKRLSSFSLIFTIRVVSSAYLRLLIFLLAILIPTGVFHMMYSAYGLPLWLSGEEYTCNAGIAGHAVSVPVLGRSPGGRHGNQLQSCCLENPLDRGAWWA